MLLLGLVFGVRDEHVVQALGLEAERLEAGIDDLGEGVAVSLDGQEGQLAVHGQKGVLGMAGRVIRHRGHLVLLDAVARLCNQGVALRLLMVGKGPERERVEQCVHQLGLQQVVTLVETYADMPAFYSALDVFVVPGRHDGVSSAALEAMAAGLPVVAANAGANMEAVKDGETGLLVPEGNAAILARILTQLAESAARRKTLGERARLHIEQHHRAETMVQRHSALYHGLGLIQPKADQ